MANPPPLYPHPRHERGLSLRHDFGPLGTPLDHRLTRFAITPSFFGQPAKCEVAHTSLPIRPSKSGIATSIWRREGTMAAKPKPASLLPGAKLGGADVHSESRGRLETARSDGFGIDLRGRC